MTVARPQLPQTLEELARFLAELLEGRRYTDAELGFTRRLPPQARQFDFLATTTPRLALTSNLQRSEFVIENPSTNTDRVEWGDELLLVGTNGLRVALGGTVAKSGWKGEVYIGAASGQQRVVIREESVA